MENENEELRANKMVNKSEKDLLKERYLQIENDELKEKIRLLESKVNKDSYYSNLS